MAPLDEQGWVQDTGFALVVKNKLQFVANYFNPDRRDNAVILAQRHEVEGFLGLRLF
jgi:hypothetical protein